MQDATRVAHVPAAREVALRLSMLGRFGTYVEQGTVTPADAVLYARAVVDSLETMEAD